MSSRTTYILMGVALLLVGFIFLVERDAPTTAESDARKNHVFSTFRKDAAAGLEIAVSGSGKVVLTRVSTVESGQERWEVTAPIRSRADGTAVQEILSAIDFLTITRTVKEDVKNPRFGLSKPRIKGAYVINNQRSEFLIGADDATAENVYVARTDTPDTVFVVHREFFDSLNRKLNDLRDRHLFSEPLSDATAITTNAASLRKVKDTEIWEVKEGSDWIVASRGQVLEQLDMIGNLSAVQFVDDPSRRPRTWTHSFTATRADGKKEKIQIGGSCGDKLFFAAVEGSAELSCVSADIADLLARPAARFFEKRPIAAEATEVTRLTVERDGQKVVVEKTPEDLWQIGGKTVPLTDQVAVSSFVEDYNKTAADAVIGLSTLPKDALKIVAQLRFELDAGQPAVLLTVHAPVPNPDGTTSLYVRRNAEPILLQMKSSLLDRIWADELAFARRTLENGNPQLLVRIERSGFINESLQRESDKAWRIDSPVSLDADQDLATKIAGLITNPTAVRFVESSIADSAARLTTPWLIVRGHFQKDPKRGDIASSTSTVTLEIGAQTENNERYARIAGQKNKVFLLSVEDIKTLTALAAARHLVAIDPVQAARVEIRNGDRVVSARQEGTQWVPTDAVIDSARLGRLMIDLSALKAHTANSWGKSIDKPAVIVELYSADGKTLEQLSFSASPGVEGDNGDKECRVVKSGLDVIWTLPCRVSDDLLALFATGGP